MSTKTISNADILAIVKRHVDRHQNDGQRLRVLDDAVMHVQQGIAESDDRWYVAVRPDNDEESTLAWYAEKTGKIEDEIQAEDGLNIYLQSILPHY